MWRLSSQLNNITTYGFGPQLLRALDPSVPSFGGASLTPKEKKAVLHIYWAPHFLQAEWLNGMSAVLLFFNPSFRKYEDYFFPSSFNDVGALNSSGNG